MNVLVTGATGFVGGHLVDRLLGQGDTVTALVRSRTRAAPLAARGVRLVDGDLANRRALNEATTDQDVVYHVAALLGARTEAELLQANRDGTRNVAEAVAAQARPPRIVLVSSMAAGGPAAVNSPKRDASADHPVTAYGRSKLASEIALREIASDWVIVRPPVVYGPRDREGLLPLFRAVRWGVSPTFGSGEMQLSLIHVSDLTDALALAAVNARCANAVWYVNHPSMTTALQLMQAIARTLGRTPVPLRIPAWATRGALALTGAWADLFNRPTILHPDKIHEFYQPAWTGDPSGFIAATGWTPRWDLDDGLRQTADWYREARWL